MALAAAAPQTMMSVLVPAGVSEGERFTVSTPDGASVVVAVPPGAATGAVIADAAPHRARWSSPSPSARTSGRTRDGGGRAARRAAAAAARGGRRRVLLRLRRERDARAQAAARLRERPGGGRVHVRDRLVRPALRPRNDRVHLVDVLRSRQRARAEPACGIWKGCADRRPGARAYVAVAALIVLVRVLLVVNVSGDEPEQITGMDYADRMYQREKVMGHDDYYDDASELCRHVWPRYGTHIAGVECKNAAATAANATAAANATTALYFCERQRDGMSLPPIMAACASYARRARAPVQRFQRRERLREGLRAAVRRRLHRRRSRRRRRRRSRRRRRLSRRRSCQRHRPRRRTGTSAPPRASDDQGNTVDCISADGLLYDIFPVLNGIVTCGANDANSCPDGTDIWVPRTYEHAKAVHTTSTATRAGPRRHLPPRRRLLQLAHRTR